MLKAERGRSIVTTLRDCIGVITVGIHSSGTSKFSLAQDSKIRTPTSALALCCLGVAFMTKL